MVNSGDLRSTGAVGSAGVETARMKMNTRTTEVNLCLCIRPIASHFRRLHSRSAHRIPYYARPLAQTAWFHLCTIRCISAAPTLAASSALCCPLTTLATILGISDVVKISMYAGVAYPGTPRLGVQCSASLRAVYLVGG